MHQCINSKRKISVIIGSTARYRELLESPIPVLTVTSLQKQIIVVTYLTGEEKTFVPIDEFTIVTTACDTCTRIEYIDCRRYLTSQRIFNGSSTYEERLIITGNLMCSITCRSRHSYFTEFLVVVQHPVQVEFIGIADTLAEFTEIEHGRRKLSGG